MYKTFKNAKPLHEAEEKAAAEAKREAEENAAGEAEREAEEKTAHEAEYAGLVREYEDLSKISLEVFLEVSEEDLRAEFRRLNMKLAHKLAFFVLYRKARGGVSSSAPAAIVSETSQVDEKPLINIIYASFGSPSLYSLSYYCY